MVAKFPTLGILATLAILVHCDINVTWQPCHHTHCKLLLLKKIAKVAIVGYTRAHERLRPHALLHRVVRKGCQRKKPDTYYDDLTEELQAEINADETLRPPTT